MFASALPRAACVLRTVFSTVFTTVFTTAVAIGSTMAAAQTVAAAGPAGTVRAWGFNQSGQTTVPTDIGSAVAVAGGDDFSLALRVNGTVRAWGLNGSGQCDVPAGLGGVIAIGAGSYHAAALKADQTVACWGNNSVGQCDQPPELAGVIALAVGSLHNVALKSDGTIACWGDNHTNQCDVPFDLGPAIGVGAGLDHSVAIKANGDVRCWGYNAANQLNVPATLHNVTKVAAGAMHTLALTSSGGVVAWGDTSNGKCNVPASAVNVVAIAAGFEHSVALKASGTVICWGQNLAIFGSPCTVPANVGVAVGIGAGGRHTMALSQVAPMPTVSLVSATPSNCDSGNGAIDVTVTNTTSVAWTGPNGFAASTVDLTGLAPGGYTITAMGAGGTASLSVAVNAAPDTVAPVIAGYTASASSAASASCTAAVPNFAASVQASDNCTPAAQLVVIQSPAAGALVGLGAHPVTITVQDGSDNSASVTATFTVTGAATTYYRDSDGDTYGNSAVTATSCAGGAPAGFVANATDCNDANAAVHPGAVEVCGDGIDNNCSGAIDEGCAPFTVSMTAAGAAGSPARPTVGVPYVVRVACSAAGSALTGEQLAVHFDAARLALVDVVRVAGSPFTLETAREIDNAAGTLRYAADAPSGSAGLAGAAELVDLVFSVRPDAPLCGNAVLATFEPVGAAVTRFTRASAAPLVPVASNLAAVQLDATAPVLSGVPASDIDVAADAGSVLGARVALPTVTALDACDGAVAVIRKGAPADGVFPIGTTTVTWCAVDAAGNATIVNRTVTVEPYQLLDLAVCVDGAFAGNSTRQVRVTVGAAASVVSVPFTQACGTVSAYHVPVSASFACVTAKDIAHSLSGHAAATIVGTRYSASVSLKQGDSNDDDMVDIVDFGLLVDDFGGPRAADARSNFDTNAVVNNGDFAFISVNYLRTGDPCVAGANPLHPRERVSVKQLRREGLGRLESADINRDGWVDAVDVQMFLQGRRSGGAPQRADVPRESGGVAW